MRSPGHTDARVEQEKVEFASHAWVELAESILTDLVSTQGKQEDEFAVCEVFHNVPEHVHSEGTVAWHFHINGRSVVVGVGEVEDVDMRIVAEYTEALVAARLVYPPDALAAREPDAIQLPEYLLELHNRLAVRTA